MKDNLRFTLVVIGIFAVFFLMGREIFETRFRLKNVEQQAARDKKEKVWLQDELKTTREELVKTEIDLKNTMYKLDFVNRKIAVLRGDNTALLKARQSLESKIAMLEEEKKIIEARFHSLNELKNAIRQVKREIREDKIIQRQEYVRQQKEIEKWETAAGNHGFLTKDGEDYYRPKVNVDVRPANISSNKK